MNINLTEQFPHLPHAPIVEAVIEIRAREDQMERTHCDRKVETRAFGFFHHDTMAVPGHPYAVNVVRTIQLPQDPRTQGLGIILDRDVFTMRPFEISQELMNTRLAEMRWLKNKVFFGSVTQKALENFR